MRRARITYEGALHHGMNRGHEGRIIFVDDEDKAYFVELLAKNAELTRVRILAYCLMDTHYHLVLQNLSGRMCEFFKQLNGQYGTHFRKRYGGRGYVFQDRYKSKLIQDEAYLMMVIAYVLNNPVKEKLVRSFEQYRWSSGGLYFTQYDGKMVDCAYVNDLFGSLKELKRRALSVMDLEDLPTVKSEMGQIIGGEEFIPKAMEMAERRSGRESPGIRRLDDGHFEPVEKVIQEFERQHGLKIDDLNTKTHAGKRLRTELLVHLKDRAGLRYVDIKQIDIFGNLSLGGLGSNYNQYQKCKEK